LQGEEYGEVAQALRDGRFADLPVTGPERLLLDFVATVSRHAYRVTDAQVDRLRAAGWTDEQIAEAVYDAALFSFFVRVADAFGIEPFPATEPGGPPAALTAE
jgi:alkylhydroperoxidase family enzyme